MDDYHLSENAESQVIQIQVPKESQIEENKMTGKETINDSSKHLRHNFFDHKSGQIWAFLNYLGYFVIKPAQIAKPQISENAVSICLLASPITVPICILTSPLFFTIRSVVNIKGYINNVQEQKRVKKIEHWFDSNFTNDLTQQTLRKALKSTQNNPILAQKKRLVIISQAKSKRKDQNQDQDQNQNQNQDQDKEQNQLESKPEKELIFIADEKITLIEMVKVVKQKFGTERQSLQFFLDSKVLKTDTKISELKHNEFGMIRISFVRAEAFG